MSAGGSGKGGDKRQAIYDPKTTNVLEQGLTGMAMGTAMRNNPAMGQLFAAPGGSNPLASEPGYSGNTSGKGARRDMGQGGMGGKMADSKSKKLGREAAMQHFGTPFGGSSYMQ